MIRIPERHRCRLQSEINIIPLLDVLLVLLLIFIATTPMITQSVEINLPYSHQIKTVSGTQNPPVILEISGIDQYTLLIDHQRLALLPLKQVAIAAKLRWIADPQTVFLIGGDKNVPYSEIIKALNILQQVGIRSVGLMTKPI
ncbi:colicin uptake protein TolR [Candidatus Gillettellia adelgis]